MVEYRRNEEMEKEVYDACRKLLSKERKGTHVSDLLSPRQAFLRHKYGNRISDEQVGMFIAGIAHHGIIESLIAVWGDREKKEEMEGIEASIDCMRKGLPVEIKSTRAWKMDDLSQHYIDQLQMYCIIRKVLHGHAVIFYLNVKTETKKEDGSWEYYSGPKIVCWDVDFTEEEMKTERENMINNKQVLEEAKRTGDGRALPKCEKWKCPKCVYKVECKDIDRDPVISFSGGNVVVEGTEGESDRENYPDKQHM